MYFLSGNHGQPHKVFLQYCKWGEQAYLKERFFELELRVLSHNQCEITTDNGEVEMMFALPKKKAKDLAFMVIIGTK
jgi:hypothetical protein